MAQFDLAAQAVASDADHTPDDNRLGLVYFYLAHAYQRLGKLDLGEKWLQEAARYTPDDPAIPLSLGYGYSSLGRRDQARSLFDRAVGLATDWLSVHPDDMSVAYDRGLAYQALEQPDRAAAEFDAILARKPTFFVAALSAGSAYLESGDSQRAIDRIQAAIHQAEQSGADSSWGYLFLADAYNRMGNQSQAEQYYRRAVERAPGVDWMHYRQAQFYEAEGDVNTARQEYESVVTTSFDPAWAHSVLAAFLRRQQQFDRAIQEYLLVYRERPADILAQIYLAEVYMQTNQWSQARSIYIWALAQDQELEYAHVSYGNALVQMGDYQAAIAQLQRAHELDPGDGIAYFNLGRAHEAGSQAPEAMAIYQAITSAPVGTYSAEIRAYAHERLTAIARTPKSLPTVEVSATFTATATASITPTLEFTPTNTSTATPPSLSWTSAHTPSPTSTPLAPPTPTNTWLPAPTLTRRPPPPPTPTSTWLVTVQTWGKELSKWGAIHCQPYT